MIRSTSSSRRVRTALLAATVATAMLWVSPTPASATADDSDTLVFVPFNGQTTAMVRNAQTDTTTAGPKVTGRSFPGDFSGQPGTDLFLYNPGPGTDAVLHVAPTAGGHFNWEFRLEHVSGSYIPVVGDFDGNAIFDILWYAKGTNPDSIWLFKADGTHTTKNVTINGDYRVTAINTDGDGYTDLIFYAPGSGADSIWRFGPNANHTTKAISINGNYTLIPGHFGLAAEGSPQRRLLFWSKAGPDSIWTFDTSADHTSTAFPNIDGSYEPVVGTFTDQNTDAILWYRAGAPSEQFTSFTNSGAVNQLEPPTVNGSYDPVVGDYDGNGYGDIAWTNGGKATLWKFNGGGFTQATIDTHLPNTQAASIANYLFPA